jgi:hypothetical protein
MLRRAGWKTLVGVTLVVVAAAVAAANVGYYGGSGRYCTSCHQIQSSYDKWSLSAHRDMACKECHGSVFTLDPDVHATNIRHLYYQVRGRIPDRVVLRDAQVDRIAANCARCHASKASQWKSGGHSVPYATIFLSAPHNRRTRLMDDCLRCHGMFAEGGIGAVVGPVDNQGPWSLVDPAFGRRAAIPCLACHSMHERGAPAKSPDYRAPKAISYGRAPRTTSLAIFDRRERRHIPAADLPLPAMSLQGRPVAMSPDRRQAVCYQCHMPEATRTIGSGDDRTATGVHEGIGCLGCHDAHTLDARASCANCHPALSNCGLDVATMDTTYKAASSTHNVHTVACGDCHVKEVPRRKRAEKAPGSGL